VHLLQAAQRQDVSVGARRGEEFKLEVQGAITLDHIGLMVTAAIKGLGIAYVSAATAKAALAAGELVPVLADWTPPFPGPSFVLSEP